MTAGRSDQDDALEMVQLRNTFYKGKCYFALGICGISLAVIGILIGMIIFLVRTPTEPLYFVTDKVGRFLPNISLQTPNMSTDDVIAWSTEAVEAAYSYDFVNFRGQLQNAQKYFTEYGWRNYMSGLKASNNLLALQQRKLVISAKVVDKPKLLVQGLMGKSYAWKLEIPLLVTYLQPPYDDKGKFENPLLLTVIVSRQNMLSSYQGLGIVQIIGRLVAAPQSQELTAPE